ncbi:MAG TPA: adenosylmethionine decarboxylase [bacterium]|jgi:S-adenosylmethionine decarboxylase proenzyme
MKALGRQIVVEYYGCNHDVLNDVAFIKRSMRDAAIVSGATIVQEAFHLFNPHGVSGVVVIAESHLAIHTWPEYGYAAVDLFTCGEDVDPDAAFEYLKEHLGADHFTAFEMKRGILDVAGGMKLRFKPEEVLTGAEV